jgi:DNA-binding transcriptional LysR family regulator
MDKLRQMEVFVAIVDQGSFTAASDKLGLSIPAVSKALNFLETRLNRRLLARTTRSTRLTDAGATYLDACRRALDTIAEAELAVLSNQDNPGGTLTVTVPVLFGERFIVPLINAFALHYPEVNINIAYSDRTPHLLDEGVDIAIRIGYLEDSSSFAVPLGFVQCRTYAAPAYLAAHGEPVHPRDLVNHACVSFTGVTRPLKWEFCDNGSRVAIRLRPRMIVNLAPAAVQAAVHCVGITQLLSYHAASEVLDGSLQPILTVYEPGSMPVNLLYAQRRGESGKIRAFIDFVTETLRQDAYLQGAPGAMIAAASIGN